MKNVFWWILALLAIAGLLFWVYYQGYLAKYGFGVATINAEGDISHCNDSDASGNLRISNPTAKESYMCYPPLNDAAGNEIPRLWLVVEGIVKEVSFTKQQLNDQEPNPYQTRDNQTKFPDTFYNGKRREDKDEYSPTYGQLIGGEKLWYNQTRVRLDGTKYFYYVNKIDYPNTNNL